ncbi:MAG: hypothetical protein HQL50_08135 [Magnetococcales bacterium]|nr:hypothetical protein [Magnetococcales bacterium]
MSIVSQLSAHNSAQFTQFRSQVHGNSQQNSDKTNQTLSKINNSAQSAVDQKTRGETQELKTNMPHIRGTSRLQLDIYA